MFRRTVVVLVMVIFLVGSVALALAADKGNARKGKYLFRKGCRACHVDGGAAKELSPISKTQVEWEAVFAQDTYKSFACVTEWEKRSAKDLTDIFTYMYNHAYDSPSPAKCK